MASISGDTAGLEGAAAGAGEKKAALPAAPKGTSLEPASEMPSMSSSSSRSGRPCASNVWL